MTAFLIPSVVSAAWWNPASWLKNETVQTTPVQKASEVISEKIVTETITVDNPALQEKIDRLEKENKSLSAQLNKESKLLSQTANQYNDVLSKYNSLVNGLPKLEVGLKAIIKPVVDQLNQCRLALGMASVPQPPVYVPYYPPINTTIHCSSNTVLGTTYTDCY